MTRGAKLAAVLLLAAAGVAGWYAARETLQPGSPPGMVGEGERTLPAFTFPDTAGTARNSDEWANRVLVVNFWATWCPPCREEMPVLIEMQREYGPSGVQVVGIAIDDVDLVRDFGDVYGINFPVLIGSTDAIQLANRLGNRFDSLPFTAVFDRSGKTAFVQAGRITQARLEGEIRKLL